MLAWPMLRPADIDPNLSADARIDGVRLPLPPVFGCGDVKKQTMEPRTDPPPVML